MTYYEELGIPPSATGDEIRKAYRILCRLFHPDYQTDPTLSAAASIQMRRLTDIFKTLTDPNARHQYDTSLLAIHPLDSPIPPRTPVVFAGTLAPAFRGSFLSFVLTALSAICITFCAVWLSSGDLTTFRRLSDPPLARTPILTLPEDGPPPSATTPISVMQPAPHPMPPTRAVTIKGPNLKPVLSTPSNGKDRPTLPVKPILEPAANPAPALIPSASPQPVPKTSSIVGQWFYAVETSKSTPPPGIKFYPPEFIQLSLWIENQSLRGHYDARYHITDRAISTEVTFDFEGFDESGGAVPWHAVDGSRGIIEMKCLTPQSLQVDWRTSTFGTKLGLGAGTAVLIRRAKQ